VADWEARFEDAQGAERTTITSDGRSLRMRLRGVELAGHSLDDFEPVPGTPPEAEASLPLHPTHRELCSCRLEVAIPVPLVQGEEEVSGTLTAHLELGDPDQRNAIDREQLRLVVLEVGDVSWASKGQSGWFEEELLDLERALPDGTRLKSCFTCAFSDYSPYGHGLFGALACFRDVREDYVCVETKFDLLKLWDKSTESVQETHLCPAYARRPVGLGYRG
jgi:hypothetical protein